MSLAQIRLHQPQTLAEALKFLRDLDEARLLAGGTDILVDIKEGESRPNHLVSLQKIDELKGIEEKSGRIRIGALTTPNEIAGHRLIRQSFPALAEAAASMASNHIRALATIGGNIASAVPSADLPPVLIAAGATVRLICSEDIRDILLLQFFLGPRQTICRQEDILTEVQIHLPEPETGISYQKVMLREANALAVASAAAKITLKEGFIDSASLVLGAVAPTPLPVHSAAEFLRGKKPTEDVFRRASQLAREESQPISDIRGSAWYRQQIVSVLTRKALIEALSRARDTEHR